MRGAGAFVISGLESLRRCPYDIHARNFDHNRRSIQWPAP